MEAKLNAEDLNERFKDFSLKGEYTGTHDPDAKLKVYGDSVNQLLLEMTNKNGFCLLVAEVKETMVPE